MVSDWGAINDRVVGLPAGLDLEMPSSRGRTDAELVAAVRDGSLDEEYLDIAAGRILDLIRKVRARAAIAGPLDAAAHHTLAREAAGRSIVLLRNEGGLLPLSPARQVAVIGAFAANPRFQGAGSSQINPTRLDSALDGIRAVAGDSVSYSAGFPLGSADTADPVALRDEAVAAASAAEVAVLFLGVPAEEESEGFDRTHIDLPAAQLELVDAVLAVNPNVVVVLSNGGVVALPFADRVPAILEGWLLGQAGGSATADVLYGAVNPSGKLTETIPLRLEDNPSYGNFPGELGHVRYGEGILVGYRWYDAKKLEVAFPFGHGLSYTTFGYGDATASLTASGDVIVTAPVTNTGSVAGREVVQVYTSLADSVVQRAPRELKGFAVVALEPDETTTVEVTLRRSELAYWDVRVDGWVVEGGEYVVEVGASSRDLRSRTSVLIEGESVELPLSLASSIDEVLEHPMAGPALRAVIDAQFGAGSDIIKILGNFPVGRLDGIPMPREDMEKLIAEALA